MHRDMRLFDSHRIRDRASRRITVGTLFALSMAAGISAVGAADAQSTTDTDRRPVFSAASVKSSSRRARAARISCLVVECLPTASRSNC